MAARKLQVEIDRTLKRIDEGILEFDAVYERVGAAETQAQKEKYEEELKKETKKLQKFRDSLKVWAASAEIKNKQPLLDARKNIERKMELFKAVERETKVKAYSREGLSRDAPMSADERKRLKSREWVQDSAQQLSDMLDQVETELETIENPKTKREKEVVAHLENVIKNHRWHIDRLEGVIRLLDNAAVEADDVDQIKDNIDDYVERGKDEDYEMDLELYNGFEGLTIGDDTDTDFPTTDDEEAKKASAGAGAAKRESDNDTKAPSTAAAPVAAPAPAPVKATPPASTVTKPTTTTQPAITATKVPMPTDTSAGRGRGTPIPDIKPSVTTAPALPTTKATVGTVAVTGVASTTTAAGRGRGNIVPAVVPGNPPLARSISAPNAANAPAPLPATSAVSATSVATASSSKAGDSLANIVRGKPTPSASTPTTTGATPHPPPAAAVTYASITGTSQPVEAKPAAVVPTFTIDPATAAAQLSTAISTASVLAPAPAILDNAHVMLPLASQRFNLAALQLSLAHIPEPIDCERPKSYAPRNPTSHTHSSFPTTPAAALESPALFERMEVDTLFFLFYYQQGTYLQYLAAKQLKRHSWRFHKKYFAWFKRQEEPKHTTADHEQGTYVYFDYEMGWLIRVKKDFVFDYAYLEDELV